MDSAKDYLACLYKEVKPQHVVEIGADTPMRLAAQTAFVVPRISIVAFESDNAFRKGWWDMHQEMGIPVERVDGDARYLSQITPPIDIVYSHCVLYSCEQGADIRRLIAHRNGKSTLGRDELANLRAGFEQAEVQAIREAANVARNGHVIWFTYNGAQNLFTQLASEQSRGFTQGNVLRMCGEDKSDVLKVYHLNTPK